MEDDPLILAHIQAHRINDAKRQAERYRFWQDGLAWVDANGVIHLEQPPISGSPHAGGSSDEGE